MKHLLASVALAGCLSLSTAASALPVVGLSAWQTSNGTGMRFVQQSPEIVDASTMLLPDETPDGAYRYAVNTSELKWGADCMCYRYYVILARATATGVLTRHKFKGIPSGSFLDQSAPVRLSITDVSGVHTDDIALPVASAPGLEPSPLIEVKTDKPLQAVSLGGITEIQLTVQNPSSHDPIDILTEVIVTPLSRTLWKTQPSISGGPLPFTLDPRQAKTVAVRLEPKVKESIAASFPPIDAELEHTAVTIDVPFSSRTFSGRQGRESVRIPLRFKPGLVELGVVLLIGVVVGSTLSVFLGGKASLRKWPRAFGAAAVVGLALELFGILLAQNKSKLMVFGFDIDPWQTTPVIVLGLLTGLMGLRAAKLIEDRLPKQPGTPAPTN